MPVDLEYPAFDADNHMHDTTDAFTKYLPPDYAGLVKYIEINGRTKIALRNVSSEYIPSRAFNKEAPPGCPGDEQLREPDLRHSGHNLSIVDVAIKELEYVVGRGARAVLSRPANRPGLRRPYRAPPPPPSLPAPGDNTLNGQRPRLSDRRAL